MMAPCTRPEELLPNFFAAILASDAPDTVPLALAVALALAFAATPLTSSFNLSAGSLIG